MIFADIYRTNSWNGVESMSGPGSGPTATLRIARAIVALVDQLGIRSVLDVGCGDGYWMPDLPGYVGIDVVPQALDLARARHPDRVYRTEPLGTFDLVFTRDVMQHLSLEDGLAMLAAIRATGSTWLLASTYFDCENRDIPTGHYFEPNLEAEPFSLGPPVSMIFDGYGYSDPDEVRDPRKYLGLWSLTPEIMRID